MSLADRVEDGGRASEALGLGFLQMDWLKGCRDGETVIAGRSTVISLTVRVIELNGER